MTNKSRGMLFALVVVSCSAFAQSSAQNRPEAWTGSGADVNPAVSSRLAPLASIINRVFLETGLIGLRELVEDCYLAPSHRGHDCLVIDSASMFINRVGPNPTGMPFFSADEHKARITSFALKTKSKVAAIESIHKYIIDHIPKTMLDDLNTLQERENRACIVIDPDISNSFTGECADRFANGYGMARGRDEYRGEFKNGYTHGVGKYIWGEGSKWVGEMYSGSTHKGAKNGFGVWSLPNDSQHPALEFAKKNGALSDGRYYVYGLFAAGKQVAHCKSEWSCLQLVPTFTFPEIYGLIADSAGSVDLGEIKQLTQSAFVRKGERASSNPVCLASELLNDYFGFGSDTRAVAREELRGYHNFLSDKLQVTRIFFFCQD